MSKALIITGADFSTNKVATITFASVPCEGISFSQNTYTLTSTDPVTVSYTLTPSNTTDAVTWTSSDNTVVSVSGGTMTINGIGTATITAACGNFTATATVTVSIAYIANYGFYMPAHAEGKTFVSANAVRSRLAAFGSGSQSGDHVIVTANLYPIVPPTNTTKIKINVTTTSNFYNSADSKIFWMSDTACGDDSYPDAATYVSVVAFNPRSDVPYEASIPEGADCFVLLFHLASTQADDVVANTFASNNGISIEFLTT